MNRSRRFYSIDLLVVVLITLVILWFFRGWIEQGMEMDEVSRVSNVIPLFHEDALPTNQDFYNLKILDVEIPVMYKEYISSAYLIRFFPLVLFEDYVFGLRMLHLTYFILACLSLYLVLRRFGRYAAAMTALLIAAGPIFYPFARIGFADTFHLIFLAGIIALVARYVKKPEQRWLPFAASFLLFFTANQAFYFSWIVAGLGLATLLLFPEQWWSFLKDSKALGLALLGGAIGLVHFVIYNLSEGFPTFRILFLKIFFPAEYNLNPVDSTPAQPLVEELAFKLDKIAGFLGPAALPSAVILILVLLVSGTALVTSLRQGNFREKRISFLPLLAFLLIFGLILISPKTHRDGHYVYVSPFWELSVIAAAGPLLGIFANRKWARRSLILVPLLLLGVHFWSTSREVRAVNRTGGTGLFTPAVFEYVEYLNEQQIDSRNVVFLTWGLYVQPYFINKGRFHLNTLVYPLYSVTDPAVQERILKDFLISSKTLATRLPESLYFPLYSERRSDLNEALHRIANQHGADITIEKVFNEKSGAPVIEIHRLDHYPTLRANLIAEVMDTRLSEELRIVNFGPRQASLAREGALPMWFVGENLANTVKVCFEGEPLLTFYGTGEGAQPQTVTADVPVQRFDETGSYEVRLCDAVRAIHSQPVFLSLFDTSSLKMSEELSITAYGPRQVPFPAEGPLPVWFESPTLSEDVRICFQDRPYRIVGLRETIPTATTELPFHRLTEPGEYEFYLCEAARGIRSSGAKILLRSPQ